MATTIGAVGIVGTIQSLAFTVRNEDPARAHSLAPFDGRITAALARKLAVPDSGLKDRAKADQLARDALRRDPTAVAAVVTLGIDAQIRGRTDIARSALAYAQRLSRRDLQTQLWAIEDAVARQDVPGVLRQYDVALRGGSEASALLFPVLAEASTDPAIATALTKILAARPIWGTAFIEHAAQVAPPSPATARLFTGLRRAKVAVPEQASAALINRLIEKGDVATGWQYYSTIRPSVNRSLSRDPHFISNYITPSLFDWYILNEGGVTAAIQSGSLDFMAPASAGGGALQQWQFLPPGAYRLDGHNSGIEGLAGSVPYWILRCRDGRDLGRVTLSTTQAGGFFGNFTVPDNCPVQILTFIVQATNAVAGMTGGIDYALLKPLRQEQ